VRSPNNGTTMVSYECPIHLLSLLCTVHKLYAIFSYSIKNGDSSISAARGRAGPEIKCAIESSTTDS
jgi:hypothetical protein